MNLMAPSNLTKFSCIDWIKRSSWALSTRILNFLRLQASCLGFRVGASFYPYQSTTIPGDDKFLTHISSSNTCLCAHIDIFTAFKPGVLVEVVVLADAPATRTGCWACAPAPPPPPPPPTSLITSLGVLGVLGGTPWFSDNSYSPTGGNPGDGSEPLTWRPPRFV